ncbi:menaquinone biosynthesis protein [Flavihumibacter sp. R14]|nr:menaquinone biosynthesis protein [Flavihumibacter soli]
MNKVKVSAVSYTNTKPFVFGLTHSDIIDKIDLSLDIPSECANKLIADQVDVGLVPVAALLNIPQYEIISDYCIGATGAVDSVFIFSDKPIEEITSIRLDTHSRTSNNLALVLLKNYWKLNPQVVETEGDAFVLIGDRTFGKKHEYRYAYDLAKEWHNFTSLPFAFAVWAANKPLSTEFIQEFNKALKFGLENRLEVIKDKAINGFDYKDYLQNKLDFNLDEKKRQAIEMFHNYVLAL